MHFGQTDAVHAAWQVTLDQAFAEHPARFAPTLTPDAFVHRRVAALDIPALPVDTDTLVTDHIALDRLVEDGLEELLHNADQHIKILVDPA